MDVRRHVTAGRLSELFGEDALETDKFVRTMGWRRVAEQELAAARARDPRRARGLRRRGQRLPRPTRAQPRSRVEYTVLGLGGLDYTPEQWTPVDSLAWLKAMAWDLRGNMDDELDRVLAVGRPHAGRRSPSSTRPTPTTSTAPIVDAGRRRRRRLRAGRHRQRHPQPAPAGVHRRRGRGALEPRCRPRARRDCPALLGRGDGIGSNAWVVDGEHTATGEPLLANDPHLGVSMPGHLDPDGPALPRRSRADCPLDVAGFTFSGVPGRGHRPQRRHRLGLHQPRPGRHRPLPRAGRGRRRWRYDGELRAAARSATRRSRSRRRRRRRSRVRATVHGPLLSDVSTELRDGRRQRAGRRAGATAATAYAVALAWTALTPAPHRRRDPRPRPRDATGTSSARPPPLRGAAQNLVYADRDGHIGYQAPGPVPIRKSGNDGALPVGGLAPARTTGPATTSRSTALPSVLDPEEGFIVTANQAVIGPDYPYFLDRRLGPRLPLASGSATCSSARGRRCRSPTWPRSSSTPATRWPPMLVPYLLDVDLPRGYYARRPAAAARLGLHAARRQRAPAAYFNASGATCSR